MNRPLCFYNKNKEMHGIYRRGEAFNRNSVPFIGYLKNKCFALTDIYIAVDGYITWANGRFPKDGTGSPYKILFIASGFFPDGKILS